MTPLTAETFVEVERLRAEAERFKSAVPAQEETKRAFTYGAVLVFGIIMMCVYPEARKEIALMLGGLGVADVIRRAIGKK